MCLELSETGVPELFAAFAKAQSSMGDVLKQANNPAFKSKYADLASVVEAVTPALNANGLAMIQAPGFDGEVVSVETIIAHSGGGFMRSTFRLRPGKPDAHGLGSAVTYARRYSLMAVCGVAPEDDDGNAASAKGDGGQKFDPAPVAPKGKSAARADFTDLVNDMRSCGSVGLLDDFMTEESTKLRYRQLPADWQQEIVTERRTLNAKLRAAEAAADITMHEAA